mmetsp:Transcript_35681/g.93676  ORF Transcript_35681/g.93676 Transcript_35681/m.93676 type:complete len:241 (+) Transcript_35681:3148-3870(+)
MLLPTMIPVPALMFHVSVPEPRSMMAGARADDDAGADEDADALLSLFSSKKAPRAKEEGEEDEDDMEDEQDDAGEEDQDDDEEEEEDEEEDDDDDDDDDEANDDEGEGEGDDDEVDDDLALILAQQKMKDKKEAVLLKDQGAANDIRSPRVETRKALEDATNKHRRKGVPMRSLPAPRALLPASNDNPKAADGSGSDARTTEERPTASTAEVSGVVARHASAVRVRRRKPAKPSAGLSLA